MNKIAPKLVKLVDDLLLLLDMTSATRQTVATALGNLPTDFPACRDWLD